MAGNKYTDLELQLEAAPKKGLGGNARLLGTKRGGSRMQIPWGVIYRVEARE